MIPCRDCALRIIQSGFIKRVFYAEYYESRSSKDVEALFAGNDPTTIEVLTKRFGPQANGWVPHTRVELIKFGVTIPEPTDLGALVDKILFSVGNCHDSSELWSAMRRDPESYRRAIRAALTPR